MISEEQANHIVKIKKTLEYLETGFGEHAGVYVDDLIKKKLAKMGYEHFNPKPPLNTVYRSWEVFYQNIMRGPHIYCPDLEVFGAKTQISEGNYRGHRKDFVRSGILWFSPKCILKHETNTLELTFARTVDIITGIWIKEDLGKRIIKISLISQGKVLYSSTELSKILKLRMVNHYKDNEYKVASYRYHCGATENFMDLENKEARDKAGDLVRTVFSTIFSEKMYKFTLGHKFYLPVTCFAFHNLTLQLQVSSLKEDDELLLSGVVLHTTGDEVWHAANESMQPIHGTGIMYKDGCIFDYACEQVAQSTPK